MEDLINTATGYVMPVYDIAFAWIVNPANWVQFALLVAAYLIAVVVTRKVNPRLKSALTPADGNQSLLSKLRRFVLLFLPLLLPLFAFAFTAIGEQVTRSVFGSGDVIAFGKRVFLFLSLIHISEPTRPY